MLRILLSLVLIGFVPAAASAQGKTRAGRVQYVLPKAHLRLGIQHLRDFHSPIKNQLKRQVAGRHADY